MPDINDYYPEIFAMEVFELHALREELLAPAKETGDFKTTPTEDLAKLAAVQRALRRKAVPAGRPSRKAPKKQTSLEDLV